MTDKKMSTSLSQIKDLVADSLNRLGKRYSKPEAVELVLATGLVESRYKYIKQIGSEIALSYWQIEVDTAIDCVQNYLAFRIPLAKKCAEVSDTPLSLWMSTDRLRWRKVLQSNMVVAIILCRLKYWRDPKPLGKTTSQMANTWKRVYNTEGGAGTVAHFMEIVGKHI
tara:strand:- start:921 stop:1424 length:504 start_codon:yes stop_codon:yes gene_type:complete